MFPQIFDADGKAAAAAAANPLRNHSDFMKSTITNEIYTDTQQHTSQQEHGVVTRRWFNGKDHAHYMKMYNKDFEKKRSLFTERDMDEVHAEYMRDRELRDRRLGETTL